MIASDRIPMTSIDMPRLQSLLSYLVQHHGVPQSRTRLASLLWPDSTEEQAHTNLRNLLYKLRQALPESDRYLSVDRHTILWQSDGSWTLDVLDFEQAVARAEQAEQEDNHAALRMALEQAVELYRGDLLPDCYDEWILPERDRLSQLFLDVLEWLLCLREQEGDYQGAISHRTALAARGLLAGGELSPPDAPVCREWQSHCRGSDLPTLCCSASARTGGGTRSRDPSSL